MQVLLQVWPSSLCRSYSFCQACQVPVCLKAKYQGSLHCVVTLVPRAADNGPMVAVCVIRSSTVCLLFDIA